MLIWAGTLHCKVAMGKRKGSSRGAAWGAQPRAERAASEGNHRMGDFGRYMAHKVQKLGHQFRVDASMRKSSEDIDSAECSVLPNLFEGVSIYVNGYTTPSHQELRELMVKYGGRFENYFSKERVTHIICSNLPDSKWKDFQSFSRGLPVVKPEWLVESIAAGKLLHCDLFHIQQVSLNRQQRKLSSFFGSEKDGTASMSSTTSMSSKTDGEITSRLNINPSTSEEAADLLQIPVAVELHPITCEDGDESEGDVVEADAECQAVSGLHSRTSMHSTLGDPNFVENYFKSSRLHFIGTWRNRYQQKHKIIQKSSSDQLAVIHIDMDCFFVSVVIRNHPAMAGKPVAVCHSDSSRGTAEISSANYEARSYGIKAGMFVRDAKSRCPALEIMPYDFEGYEQVAETFYDILHQHSPIVQAVSCDEAYIDVTGMGDPAEIASKIRQGIFDATKCTASAGISVNVLLARLATKKAKPNGQYQICLHEAEQFMADLPVEDLPGVGWSLREKLHGKNVFTCSELKAISKESLQREFGLKIGEMLWNYSRGIDTRKVQSGQERKSIGADVNWGVRFTSPDDASRFLVSLCDEVSTRLKKAAFAGRTITLKVKKRRAGAGEPEKFMGCGICDNISRSATLPSSTDQPEVILKVARNLLASLNIAVCEIRGVGLQVTRLEASSCGGRSLKTLFESSVKKEKGKEVSVQKLDGPSIPVGDACPKEMPSSSRLPLASELDYSVLRSLPPEVFAEINQAYNGVLVLSSRGEGQSSKSGGLIRNDDEPGAAYPSSTIFVPPVSQLDMSILEELPTQLREEIVSALPASNENEVPQSVETEHLNGLWDGFPPTWVQQFQESRDETLKGIAAVYRSKDYPKYLSHLLLALFILPNDTYGEASISQCVELITQYAKGTLSTDLEEVMAVVLILKRMAAKWFYWSEVMVRVLEAIERDVFEVYGGHLRM